MTNLGHWKRVFEQQLSVQDNALTVINASHVNRLCREAGYQWRERVWPPYLVLPTFLCQVLSATKSCRSAVITVVSQLVASGYEGEIPSEDDSPYCQARQRLPLGVMLVLLRQISTAFCQVGDESCRWCGRNVRVVDGSSVSMPDTPKLQAEFPQPDRQQPGCGFPTARLTALFDWATGAVIDIAVDKLKVGEIHLGRRLWSHLRSGDVLLGDRLYGSYADFAKLRERGVDSVSRMQQRRKADYRLGQRLGKHDRLVTWDRPVKHVRPRGMSVKEWDSLPQTLVVRMLRVTAEAQGFRSQIIHLTTTLWDAKQYPADQIAQLYRDRWMAELNLRSLKTHLGMEVLRGKSPDVVRKEIAMHAIA